MRAVDLLGQVREKSISNLAIELAEGGDNNPYSGDQIEKFFELLHDSVSSNDPELIIPVINEWLGEELSGGRTSLLEVTDLILQQTYKIAAEEYQKEVVDTEMVGIEELCKEDWIEDRFYYYLSNEFMGE